jgi:predicted metalloendopeptidase
MENISFSTQLSNVACIIRIPVNLSVLLAAILLLASCGKAPNSASHAKHPREDFLRANMDFTANPGNDFFAYANGAWLKAHPIPASEAGWGIGNVVREELYVKLRKIDEDSAKANADVHAPAKWRVLGPLSNILEFYEAFGIKPGQPMWRTDDTRAHIW